jgi:hypothetical protein
MPEWGDFGWTDADSPPEPLRPGDPDQNYWGLDVTPQTAYDLGLIQGAVPWAPQAPSVRFACHHVTALDPDTWADVHQVQGIQAQGSERTGTLADGLVQQEDLTLNILDPQGYYRTGAGADYLRMGKLLRLDMGIGGRAGYREWAQMVFRVTSPPQIQDGSGLRITLAAQDWGRYIIYRGILNGGGEIATIPGVAPFSTMILAAKQLAARADVSAAAAAIFGGDADWYNTIVGIFWANLFDITKGRFTVLGSLRNTIQQFHLKPVVYTYQTQNVGGLVTNSYTLQPWQLFQDEVFLEQPTWYAMLSRFFLASPDEPGLASLACGLFYMADGTLALAKFADRDAVGVPGQAVACTEIDDALYAIPARGISQKYAEPAINEVTIQGFLYSPTPTNVPAAPGEPAEGTPPPGGLTPPVLEPEPIELQPPVIPNPPPLPPGIAPPFLGAPVAPPAWPDHPLPPTTEAEDPNSYSLAPLEVVLPSESVPSAAALTAWLELPEETRTRLGGLLRASEGHYRLDASLMALGSFGPLALPGEGWGTPLLPQNLVTLRLPPGALRDEAREDQKKIIPFLNPLVPLPTDPDQWASSQLIAAESYARAVLMGYARVAYQLTLQVDSAWPFHQVGQTFHVYLEDNTEHAGVNGVFILTNIQVPFGPEAATWQGEWVGELATG